MKNKNYYGLFYKNRGKLTGPYAGEIYTESEIIHFEGSAENFVKTNNRNASKKFVLKKLVWK